MHVFHGGPATERGEKTPESIIGGTAREESVEKSHRLRHVARSRARSGARCPGRRLPQQTLTLHLERAQRLLHRRLEGAVDGHDLAGGLHLRSERPVGAGELIEGPTRDLHDDVVERGLECGGGPLRDRIRDLVQPFADGDLRRDARDRITRGLRRERRRSRHAWVHLDDVVRDLRVRVGRRRTLGMQRELHVAAAFDAERADDPKRRAAEHLVFLVGERL